MDACPDWDHVQSHKAVKLPVIRNGLLCEAIKVDKMMIYAKRTCAFDSLVQLLAQTIGKERQYRSEIENLDTENTTLKLALGILSRGKITSGDHASSARILKTIDICVQSKTRHIIFLDAKCNAGHLIDKLFNEMIPSVSRIT